MSLSQVIEEVANVVEQLDTPYAYRFVYMRDHAAEAGQRGVLKPGAELLEVRVLADGSYVLTPCDQAGRPMDAPKPGGDAEPFHIGRGVSNPAPATIRDQIREEERAAAQAALEAALVKEEAELPEPAPTPKKKGWFRRG